MEEQLINFTYFLFLKQTLLVYSLVDLHHNWLVVHVPTIICNHADPELVFVQDQSLWSFVSITKLGELVSILIEETNATNTLRITISILIKLDLGDGGVVGNNIFFIWFFIFMLLPKNWSLVSILEQQLQTIEAPITSIMILDFLELKCLWDSIELILDVILLRVV